MPRITPALTVRDAEAAQRFYEQAFGFQAEHDKCMRGPDGTLVHCYMRFGEGGIMFGQEGAMGCQERAPASSGTSIPSSLYVYCDDVDALAERAAQAGAQIVQEPVDMFWGDRMCVVTDPDGYRWIFATNVADFDPSKVPTMAGAGAGT
jgi:uncharacterized glyoxalase superfamily protein PhnB